MVNNNKIYMLTPAQTGGVITKNDTKWFTPAKPGEKTAAELDIFGTGPDQPGTSYDNDPIALIADKTASNPYITNNPTTLRNPYMQYTYGQVGGTESVTGRMTDNISDRGIAQYHEQVQMPTPPSIVTSGLTLLGAVALVAGGIVVGVMFKDKIQSGISRMKSGQ